ncbi:hypothetical protein D9M69_356210 [compost metagenome]
MPKAAAELKSRPAGIGITLSPATATCSAKAPQPVSAMTRSPGLTWATFSPTATTTPAASPPGEKGNGGLNWYLPSMIRVSGKLTPAACTSRSTSNFFGAGLGTSSSTRVSAGPKALHSTAFMGDSLCL